MPVTDQIADFITRIRNAGAAGNKKVSAPKSKVKVAIANILKDQGYIEDFKVIDEGVQGTIEVSIRYYRKKPSILEIKRISKPGRRIYVPAEKLPRVRNGLGIAIVSTSKGVMTDKQARKMNVGGEVLCTVW